MSCSYTKTGFPDRTDGSEGHEIFDEDFIDENGNPSPRWRTITIADRLCWDGRYPEAATTQAPATEATTQATTQGSTAGSTAGTTAGTTKAPTTTQKLRLKTKAISFIFYSLKILYESYEKIQV